MSHFISPGFTIAIYYMLTDIRTFGRSFSVPFCVLFTFCLHMCRHKNNWLCKFHFISVFVLSKYLICSLTFWLHHCDSLFGFLVCALFLRTFVGTEITDCIGLIFWGNRTIRIYQSLTDILALEGCLFVLLCGLGVVAAHMCLCLNN